MVFSSIFFIFVFLPVFLLLYYITPVRFQNIVLVIGSLFFYAWGDPTYLLLMIFASVFNYYMGIELERTRQTDRLGKFNLIFTIIINLFILCFFKYTGFLMDSIGSIIGQTLPAPQLGLPIGLSFYTFKNLSYVFDIYKGKTKAQYNFLNFATYSMMFPHMVSGPIIRYADIEDQITNRGKSLQKIGVGSEMFIKGLAKKVLLADNLALIYSGITSGNQNLSMTTAWIAALAYSLQLYFDFSGYSDMAIGLGRMMGFTFPKNFDYPYTSSSVSEFWRRWHISLGSWFRDYIYIPLGGNRVALPKQIRNILVVWALTGLWHGASWNFVLWGVYYGILLLIEKFLLGKILERLPKVLSVTITFLIVVIGWVLFSHTNFAEMGHYLSAMFGFGAAGIIDGTAFYYLKTGLVLFILSFIICRPSTYQLYKKLMHKQPVIAVAVNVILVILCIAFMVYNSYTPFLYLKF